MPDRERSAIGGGDLSKSMNNAIREVEDILGKYDWSDMSSEQHTEFTSKLYSVVQQKTDPKLQKNTRTGADAGADRRR